MSLLKAQDQHREQCENLVFAQLTGAKNAIQIFLIAVFHYVVLFLIFVMPILKLAHNVRVCKHPHPSIFAPNLFSCFTAQPCILQVIDFHYVMSHVNLALYDSDVVLNLADVLILVRLVWCFWFVFIVQTVLRLVVGQGLRDLDFRFASTPSTVPHFFLSIYV